MINLMEILREIINEELELESKASDDAKRQGLEYMKFGRWGKDGKVTHKTVNGRLQPVKTARGSTAKSPTSKPAADVPYEPPIKIGPSSPTAIGPSTFSGLFGKASDDELERGRRDAEEMDYLIARYKELRQQARRRGF